MRFIFIGFLVLHSLIHLMGFARAFQPGAQLPMSSEISRPMGLAWLLAFVLIMLSAILFYKGHTYWWMLAALSAVLSQSLIATVWQDAKFGSFANMAMLMAATAGFFMHRFEDRFRDDVRMSIHIPGEMELRTVTEANLAKLPPPVQRYLHYVGVVGKPRTRNLYIRFEGEMRDRGKNWFPFVSEQYNTMKAPTRLFFMKARMFGMTVPGYHAYKDGKASMDIRLLGIVPVMRHQEAELFKTETVTYLNDLCLFAPMELLDERITWQTYTDTSAQLTFQHQGVTVKATLFFNADGALVNFESADRMAIQDMKYYLFSTPVGPYKDFHGFRLPSYGEAVWHYPEGAFTYGKFHVADVRYNLAQ